MDSFPGHVAGKLDCRLRPVLVRADGSNNTRRKALLLCISLADRSGLFFGARATEGFPTLVMVRKHAPLEHRIHCGNHLVFCGSLPTEHDRITPDCCRVRCVVHAEHSRNCNLGPVSHNSCSQLRPFCRISCSGRSTRGRGAACTGLEQNPIILGCFFAPNVMRFQCTNSSRLAVSFWNTQGTDSPYHRHRSSESSGEATFAFCPESEAGDFSVSIRGTCHF